MNDRETAERIVYAHTGERLMLPDLPYQKQLIEAIEKALVEAAQDARVQVGLAMIEGASGGDNADVSDAFRELGLKLIETTNDELAHLGLLTIAEKVLSESDNPHD